jgi:hypothetical protein
VPRRMDPAQQAAQIAERIDLQVAVQRRQNAEVERIEFERDFYWSKPVYLEAQRLDIPVPPFPGDIDELRNHPDWNWWITGPAGKISWALRQQPRHRLWKEIQEKKATLRAERAARWRPVVWPISLIIATLVGATGQKLVTDWLSKP